LSRLFLWENVEHNSAVRGDYVTLQYHASSEAFHPHPHAHSRKAHSRARKDLNAANTLTSAQIKRLRLSYGLSISQFACILGWEENCLEQLENGKCPTPEENALLLRLHTPAEMCRFLLSE
jgi:DNA-binding transcriptional regulator YiaG